MTIRGRSDAEVLAQVPAARARTRRWMRTAVRAADAKLDRGCLRVELTNGAMLQIPLTLIPGVAGSGHAKASEIVVDALGMGLHWPQLDIDVSLTALAATALGPGIIRSAAGAEGGRAKSHAKSEAARKNGLKGGRPRKVAEPRR